MPLVNPKWQVMTLFFKKLTLLVFIIALITSCSKDNFYNKNEIDLNKDEGLLNLILSTDNRITTKADVGVSTGDFAVSIFNKSNVKIKHWDKYSQITEGIRLNIGDYKIVSFYGDSTKTAFDSPFYKGSSNFSIKGQTSSSINVVCKMANVGVYVKWGDNIKKDYSDYKVSIYRKGFSDSLKYDKSENRIGYIPAGTLKLKIYLKDLNGKDRVVSSSTLDINANPNDLITVTLDTKPTEPAELNISFSIDNSVELKEVEVVIPSSLKPQNAPIIFSDQIVTGEHIESLEGEPQNFRLNINSPAYLENCILRINSDYLLNTIGLPQEIDLANLDVESKEKLVSLGVEHGDLLGTKINYIDLDKMLEKIPYMADVSVNSFSLEVKDAHGQKGTFEFSYSPKQVIINSLSINDNLTRSYYAIASFNTNLPQDFYVIELNKGNGWETYPFSISSESEENKNIKILNLTSSTSYSARLRYIYIEDIVTNLQSINTENAMPLANGIFDNWSQTTINGGNGTYNGKIVCDYVDGWATNNNFTTYYAKDCWSTLWNGNYGVNWRFCSGTINTDDKTVGTYAAEISTLAFYNNDVNGSWKRESVYNYTKDNGTARPGLLFLGSINGETGNYTLGIEHSARPESVSFDYKYIPIDGDLCIAYAIVYGQDGVTPIARTQTFNGSLQESFRSVSLPFEYLVADEKATKITVFFQSGSNMDISLMHHVEGDYGPSPYVRDRVVGSVLKVDNVILNY